MNSDFVRKYTLRLVGKECSSNIEMKALPVD